MAFNLQHQWCEVFLKTKVINDNLFKISELTDILNYFQEQGSISRNKTERSPTKKVTFYIIIKFFELQEMYTNTTSILSLKQSTRSYIQIIPASKKLFKPLTVWMAGSLNSVGTLTLAAGISQFSLLWLIHFIGNY